MSFSKPTEIPIWADSDVMDPVTKQNNVLTPPDEKQQTGFNVKEKPARNYFNWLGRFAGRWIRWFNQQESQAVVTDLNGIGLFTTDNALITLFAVDKTTPTRYIQAVGYKAAGAAPVLNITSSNTLTLGSGTISGNQPISGGSGNIIIYGQTKLIPS